MKLSEAMMLGSMTGKAKAEGDWRCCALGVSASVAGVKVQSMDDFLHLWPWLNHGLLNWRHLSRPIYLISHRFESGGWSMTQLAEWIKTIEPECGVCNRFECAGHVKTAAPAVLEEVPC